ncbi:hypothetical protein IJH02_01450 [Candidatus Saccharibacteria bacterium]|nr:hypothetical protein [Candidatus Saccharibacteria bacterium]
MYSGKIWITDCHGNRHEMTPEDLLKLIREDNKSKRRWFAPVSEIVEVISDPEFPEPIANELKCIILRNFADLLLGLHKRRIEHIDQLAAAYCYYSLHGKAGKRAKRLYRENLLKSAIEHPSWDEFSIRPPSDTEWRKFCNNWQKEALQNFTKRFGNDFMRFETMIENDLRSSVRRADKNGEFEQDKAWFDKRLSEIYND